MKVSSDISPGLAEEHSGRGRDWSCSPIGALKHTNMFFFFFSDRLLQLQTPFLVNSERYYKLLSPLLHIPDVPLKKFNSSFSLTQLSPPFSHSQPRCSPSDISHPRLCPGCAGAAREWMPQLLYKEGDLETWTSDGTEQPSGVNI